MQRPFLYLLFTSLFMYPSTHLSIYHLSGILRTLLSLVRMLCPSLFRQQTSVSTQSSLQIPLLFFVITSCQSPSQCFAPFCVACHSINQYLLHSYKMPGLSSVLKIQQRNRNMFVFDSSNFRLHSFKVFVNLFRLFNCYQIVNSLSLKITNVLVTHVWATFVK